MTVHLGKEIIRLKKMILQLAAKVEESVEQAVESVAQTDLDLAGKVINEDKNIDQLEIELEEECLKILALYQPVAIDLRYVVACLKINNDLERIGDLAANIAKRTTALQHFSDYNIPLDFAPMTYEVQKMLKGALDSFIDMDTDIAEEVCKNDDIVDKYNHDAHSKIKQLIKSFPDRGEFYIYLLSVSKNLERIADYATNICEDIIYMVSGNIVRHQV